MALLHRRLAVLMALAAVTAFAAGAGAQSYMWGAAAGLALSLVWRPSAAAARLAEQLGWAAAVIIFSTGLAVAVVWSGDYLPYTLAFLLVLLVTESLRPLTTVNDVRLYTLSFAVLIASTAYYPGVLFATAFVAYIAFTTLALMVGYLRRESARYSVPDIPIRRSTLVTTAALSGVAVLASALVFLAFPRLPRGWIGSARAATQGAMVGFGEGVSLGDFGGRIQPNPEIVFRVEFSNDPPDRVSALHWRGRSYDFFDGVGWTRSRSLPASGLPPSYFESRWAPGVEFRYQVFGGPPGARVLFGLHPVLNVVPRTAMRPSVDRAGDITFTGAESPVYSVRSGATRPPEPMLHAAQGAEIASSAWYLQLPELPARIPALADSITRGANSRYDAAVALERWLREEFSYTLDLPSSPREASLDHFLFVRRAGHCEYFSTAMAVMLRTIGIPARNVNGFLGGEWNGSGGYLAVTQNDAHSWVEVWIPEIGWVPFDPTPSARNDVAGSIANASFVWPVLFWWDSLQHRWTKWVLFYDLEKQVTMMRRVGDVFSRGGMSAPRLGPSRAVRDAAPWLIGVATVATLLFVLARRRSVVRELSAETRHYLALRSAYERAGYGSSGTPPIEFLEQLSAGVLPARELAVPAVLLYLRARFDEGMPTAEESAELRDAVRRIRRELRRTRRRRAVRVPVGSPPPE